MTIASIVAAVTTTFLAIGAYVLLLHYVSTARLSRALTYLQLAATFLVYGSYFALPRLIGEGFSIGRIVDPDGWILALPGTWFASYAGIVSGRRLARARRARRADVRDPRDRREPYGRTRIARLCRSPRAADEQHGLEA